MPDTPTDTPDPAEPDAAATATADAAPTPERKVGRPLLETRELCTWFPIRRGVFSRTVGHVKAVDRVTLTIHEGETLGLVGESGCGKTTFGRTILDLEHATSGDIHFFGQSIRDHASMRELRSELQMIFQDPYSSLNPRMTILDIVTEGLKQHGQLDGPEEEVARRLLTQVGLNVDSLHRYPHEFSGGQRQRICIARAISLQPKFIVCDEAVSALDVSVQAQVINLLMDLREEMKLTYLFISHDLSVVRHISHRIAVMYLGRIVEVGETDAIINSPQHPYTQALIAAVPVPNQPRREKLILAHDPPSPSKPPPGCRFHTRCPMAMDRCKVVEPQLRQHAGREVSCHLYDEA